MNEKFKKIGWCIAGGIVTVGAFILKVVYKIDRTGSGRNTDGFGRLKDGLKDAKRYNRDAVEGIDRAQEILSKATKKQNKRRD